MKGISRHVIAFYRIAGGVQGISGDMEVVSEGFKKLLRRLYDVSVDFQDVSGDFIWILILF